MQRYPVVAGQFYPADFNELHQEVVSLLGDCSHSKPVMGLMAPHAGYVYSGTTAGATFARAEVPSTVILIGPNHRGVGAQCAVCSSGSWITPLGEVAIDSELADAVIAGVDDMCTDDRAHQYEHSLEVMLPFLQLRNPQLKIVPISMMALSFARIEQIAAQLSDVMGDYAEPLLIVASSDMTHYEPADVAREKDLFALEALLDLDAKRLYQRVTQRHITMCGMCAVATMLATLSKRGATRAELVQYTNSGEVNGDYDQVVGYAGVLIS